MLSESDIVNTYSDNLFVLEDRKRTKITQVFRRTETGIYKVTVTNGLSLKMSADHTCVLVNKTEKLAKELVVGDELPICDTNEFTMNQQVKKDIIMPGKIVSIVTEDYDGYVYDFETESHLFMANGILTHNCCQIDFMKLLHGGFSTGHGHIREPNSIRSYAALACIALQSNQNDMFGGQSIAQFDRTMALGVKKTFVKELFLAVKELLMFKDFNEDSQQNFVNAMKELNLVSYKNTKNMTELINKLSKKFEHLLKKDFVKDIITKAYKIACERTERETHQAMEAVIHNLNSMQSRAGSQTPFSSLNFGTDTSPEGRLVVEQLLLAQEAGLGNGETSVFPITIFRLKKGINYDETDPNYDLFKLAMRVSAKRLFPNFENQDAPYNLQYYDPNDYRTEISTINNPVAYSCEVIR